MHRPFRVSKEYVEERGERDADGLYDWAYRYNALTFDFGDRRYSGRIYRDTPNQAHIDGPLRRTDVRSRQDLDAIERYLLQEEDGLTVVLVPSLTGGYEPLNLAEWGYPTADGWGR